jgi:ABC-2 type transport system permease protein
MTTNGVAGAPAGSIYDLGYRHYEGERHGRFYSVLSLYLESLRSIWGLGRPTGAKAAPFILLGLYAFYAFLQLALSASVGQMVSEGSWGLATYANYFATPVSIFVIFFCIAQAPELVCRDQRYSVLPLYFSRSMHKSDYALAKLSALTTALFILLMVPMVALFVGDVLMEKDTLAAINNEWPKVLPAIPSCLLIAASMGSISLAVSSFSPRRAYSAIALGAYFLVVESVVGIISGLGHQAGWAWADKMLLAAPVTSLVGAVTWFFGKPLPEGFGFPDTMGPDAYVLASLASVAVFTAVLLFRYRRMAA